MTFRQFMAVVEIRTKAVSLSTSVLAFLYVLWRTGRLDPVRAGLLLAAVLLVDMGTTAFNTFFDWWNGTDGPAFNREEDKVVIHGGVPGGSALLIGLALYAAAIIPGLLLARLAGWPVLAAGAAGMAVGFLYTGGPLPIARTPLGEVFAGGFLGSVLFVLGWFVQAGAPDGRVWLASLPSALAIAGILSVNNACDRIGDRAAGRRTLAVLIGPGGAPALAFAEIGAGWLLAAALGLAGILPRTGAPALAPFAIPAVRELALMGRRGWSHGTKGASMRSVTRAFLWFTAAAAGMLLAGILFGPGT